MTEQLNDIIISYRQPDFQKRIDNLRRKKSPAGRFSGYDSTGSHDVLDIIRKVTEKGDEAISEYTEKFDEVKLTPQQFRVSAEEIKQAHRDIEKNQPELILKHLRCQRSSNQSPHPPDKQTHPERRHLHLFPGC